MTTVVQALQPLRDLPGVVGSFAVDAQHTLVANDLSAVFRADVLANAAKRIQVLFSVVAENFEPTQQMVLRLEPYTLVLRRHLSFTLAVVCREPPSLEMLGMACSVAMRELENVLGARANAEADPEAPPMPVRRPTQPGPGPARTASRPSTPTDPKAPTATRTPSAPTGGAPAKKKGSIWG